MVIPMLNMGSRSGASAILPFPRTDTFFAVGNSSLTANGTTYTLISTGTFSGTYPASHAFTNIEATSSTTAAAGGLVQSTATAGAVGIDFGTGVTVASYRVSLDAWAYSGESPNAWTMQGSNDNSNWTTLDTMTNNTNTASGANIDRTISSPASYRYYRLNVTAANGGVSRWFMDGLYFYA